MAATETLMEEMYSYIDREVDVDHQRQRVEAERTFQVANQSQAIWALRKMQQLTRRQAAAQATARDEIDRIGRWLTDIEAKSQGELAYFEALLRDYFLREQAADPRLKSLQLPHGTLKLRNQQREYAFDERLVIPWAKENLPEAVQIKENLLKTPVKDYIKATGEVLPGVVISMRPAQFSIDLEVD